MDTKGHKNISVLNKKQDHLSLLFSNEYLVFIYKKTEKISSAIYLVTNFLKEEEPIRTRLRNVSLELLSSVLSLTEQREEERRLSMVNIIKHAFELSSFFDLSFRAGMVSEMNYSIIKKEIDFIIEELNNRVQKRGGIGNILAKDFFNINSKNSLLGDYVFNKKDIHKNISENELKVSLGGVSLITTDDLSNKGHLDIKDKEIMSDKREEKENVFNHKTERSEKILSALRQSKEMNIKELSVFIRDFSEKTIQRDLNFLLSKGLVKRTGDKRWSKYSLNK